MWIEEKRRKRCRKQRYEACMKPGGCSLNCSKQIGLGVKPNNTSGRGYKMNIYRHWRHLLIFDLRNFWTQILYLFLTSFIQSQKSTFGAFVACSSKENHVYFVLQQITFQNYLLFVILPMSREIFKNTFPKQFLLFKMHKSSKKFHVFLFILLFKV